MLPNASVAAFDSDSRVFCHFCTALQNFGAHLSGETVAA
jgi:hypothetical protein